MDNAQKAIMIGVGLFITVIIISVVLLITNLGTGLTNDSSSNLSNTSTTLQKQARYKELLRLYNGTEVTREQVFAAYENYKDTDCVVAISSSNRYSYTWKINFSDSNRYYKKSNVGNYYIYTADDEIAKNKLKTHASTNITRIDYVNNMIIAGDGGAYKDPQPSKFNAYLLYDDIDDATGKIDENNIIGILFIPIT